MKKYLSLFLVFLFSLSGIPFYVHADSSAQVSTLKNQISSNANKISQAVSDSKLKQAEKNAQSYQITQMRNQISSMNNKISSDEKNMQQVQNKLDSTQQLISKTEIKISETSVLLKSKQQQLANSLFLLYSTHSQYSILHFIFSASSFSDMIFRASAVQDIFKTDENLYLQVKGTSNVLQARKKSLLIQQQLQKNQLNQLNQLKISDLKNRQNKISDSIQLEKELSTINQNIQKDQATISTLNQQNVSLSQQISTLQAQVQQYQFNMSQVSSSYPQIKSIASAAAQKYNVSLLLILAVIQQESGFHPNVTSSAGAMGLMQLMPGTAKRLGVTSPFDPTQNINAGVRFLSELLTQFHNNIPDALAAYNAGPGAVKKYGGIPPYAQTERYTNSILSMMQNNDNNIK